MNRTRQYLTDTPFFKYHLATLSLTGGPCTVGHYCPPGATSPLLCNDGYFMNTTGASVCLPAPAGFYASALVSTSFYRICPRGHYCPLGTGSTIPPCPVGRYGRVEGLQEEDDCNACDAGMYCTIRLFIIVYSCS